MRYAEKLKDPRWQKKRLEILDDRGWACESCCDKNNTLCVHHTSYDSGAEPWDYADHRLRVLCEVCHQKEHELYRKLVDYAVDTIIRKHGVLYREITHVLVTADRIKI